MLLELRQKKKFHFQVGRVILRFLSIFKKSQASSPYEALNSLWLSSAQKDVRQETEAHVLVRTVILVFLSIFKKVRDCQLLKH